MLNDMSLEEKSLLTKEQEEEYLRLQRELLELEKKKCEEEGICEDVLSWRDITKNITTLSARSLVSGLLKISGRTW
jgi:MinD superfamily P-loop ATPase